MTEITFSEGLEKLKNLKSTRKGNDNLVKVSYAWTNSTKMSRYLLRRNGKSVFLLFKKAYVQLTLVMTVHLL